MDIEKFYGAAAGFSPNPLQRATWEAYEKSDGHPALLVRAGTGAGKTEAILFPALADPTRRRIIMVLPSKALIEDMGERVKTLLQRLASGLNMPLSLTVDMGGSCRRFSAKEAGGAHAAGNNDGNGNGNGDGWRIFHRHLFADDLIITTLDKFLFRLFGYGEAIKSYIFPHRIFGTSLGKKPFVIFDEAHEYDGTAYANFIKLIEALYIKGKSLAVMSATLPEQGIDFLDAIDATRGELAEAQAAFQSDRPGIVGFQKHLRLVDARVSSAGDPLDNSGDQFAESREESGSSDARPSVMAMMADELNRRFDPNKRIIVRMETVRDVIALYERFRDKSPLIYHGRLTARQRRGAISEIIRRQREDAGFLVLATSAIEAGCDLDAHLIITQLCNPDSLAQLAGRLNRRGRMKKAPLVIVGDAIPSHVNTLDADRLQSYLADLRAMDGVFQPELLKPYFNPPRGDWMGQILFDMLWEYVYEGDLTSKPLWDRGILVTRSWEPAVTLCTGLDQRNRPINPIQVGVSRLARRLTRDKDEIKTMKVSEALNVEDDGKWHASLLRAYYYAGNPEESRWRVREMEGRTASCYETTLICQIDPAFKDRYFHEAVGYAELPKIFLRGYRDGFRQYLDYQPKIKKGGFFALSANGWPQNSGRVWYLDRREA